MSVAGSAWAVRPRSVGARSATTAMMRLRAATGLFDGIGYTSVVEANKNRPAALLDVES
jgi:hypothetical protein